MKPQIEDANKRSSANLPVFDDAKSNVFTNYWPIFQAFHQGHQSCFGVFWLQVLEIFDCFVCWQLVRLRWWFPWTENCLIFSLQKFHHANIAFFNNISSLLSSSCICFACWRSELRSPSTFKGFCICLPFLGTNVWLYYINVGICFWLKQCCSDLGRESWEPDLPSWPPGCRDDTNIQYNLPPSNSSHRWFDRFRWRVGMLFEIGSRPQSEEWALFGWVSEGVPL